MTIHQNNQVNTSNTEAQHSALVKNEVKPDISLEGELKLNDYISDVPASQKTIDELFIWTSKQKEVTRTNMVMQLVGLFACSIGGVFLTVVLAASNPKADKTFIKDNLSLVIGSQTPILLLAGRYYFKVAKEKK